MYTRSVIKWICTILIISLIYAGVGPQLAEAATRTAPAPLLVPGFSTSANPGRFDDLLVELKTLLEEVQPQVLANPQAGMPEIERLYALEAALTQEHAQVEAYFQQIEDLIVAKDLGDEIRQRQQAFAADYETKYATLMAYLAQIDAAHRRTTGLWSWLLGRPAETDWQTLLDDTLAFLAENTPQPRQSHFDPNNLPYRSLRATEPIPPKLTAAEWQAAFPELAHSGKPPGLASMLPGSTKLAQADAPPTDADLAETIEVQFTPEITQLATDLDHNPVQIFNWVHNNIEFVPTWGSIQGAQLCLETRTCNAFDTSSLLIALLRVSGIPARYQMGTIEVPSEQAMNWLGGFSDPRAAARFAASGGVPSAGTVEHNGEMQSIRMEHVWVRAWADYVPSQGTVQMEGDTWLDLDASYKTHDFLPGTDLSVLFPLDTNAVFTHLDTTLQTNPDEASITGLDTAYVENVYQDIASKLATQYPPDQQPAALYDTFPSVHVRQSTPPALVPGGAYRILVTGPVVASLPQETRHALTLVLRDATGQELLTFTATLPQLAGKSLSLIYAPATQADLDVIASAAPDDILADPHPSTLISRIMANIPADLVQVKPIIQIDGADEISGDPVPMGEAHLLAAHFYAPTVATGDATVQTLAWGRYGITLDLAGISEEILQKQRDDDQQQADAYQPGEPVDAIASTTRDVMVLTWFHLVDRWSGAMGRFSGVAFARYPSLGFSYSPSHGTGLFGRPTTVNMDGFVIDIARQLQIAATLDGNTDLEISFALQVGAMSSLLEGTVSSALFALPGRKVGGISASSTLWAAAEQRIPIHVVDNSTIQTVLPLLDAGYNKEAIADWVNAGRTVVVAQRPPTVDGGRVYAYAALDLSTGDGAYIVEDARGGWVTDLCGEKATEYEDCPAWFRSLIDVIFWASAAFLAAFAITFAIVWVVAGTEALIPIIPTLFFYPEIAAGLIGCVSWKLNFPICTRALLQIFILMKSIIP